MAAIRAFIKSRASQIWLCFYPAYMVLAHGADGSGWMNALLLFVCFCVFWSLVADFRKFIAIVNSDTPYVALSESGLACSLPMRRTHPWRDVAGCASKNDDGRTILQLCLRGAAKLTVDIDFALAAQPKRSLDEAMAACTAWIIATRDPAETESPIHEFVDKRAASAGLRRYSIRKVLYTFAAICVIFVVVLGAMHRSVREERPMPVDGRPERRVLFLGNNRIAYHDLPRMVRDVADSAHSPIRYDIHMRAWADATLGRHWNDGRDQALLQEPWDLVILQPEGAAFMDDRSARTTDYYGTRLAHTAEAGGAHVALIANWGLGPSFFSGDAQAARSYAAKMGRETRTLAQLSSAGVIDLEGAFAEAEASAPDIAMTDDGNHPTHAGTFLAALVIYGTLSQADLSGIDWRPYDMSKATAATLKAIAARHLR